MHESIKRIESYTSEPGLRDHLLQSVVNFVLEGRERCESEEAKGNADTAMTYAVAAGALMNELRDLIRVLRERDPELFKQLAHS